jgi:hypothetical protein
MGWAVQYQDFEIYASVAAAYIVERAKAMIDGDENAL